MTPSDSPHPPAPDGREAEEVDDTGMRDLLRTLPDPGPMPEDLVRRIETRLAVELAHRDGTPFTDGADPLGDRVVALATRRSRRRPARSLAVLGAAAAGLLLTTVAVTELAGQGLGGSGTAAFAPGGRAERGDVPDARPAAGEDTSGGAADDGAAGGSADGSGAAAVADVVVLPHLGEVGPQDFARRATSGAAARDDGGRGPDLTAAQANSCWSSHRAADLYDAYYAAPATHSGDFVVVLVGLHQDGAGRAWLLPGACANGSLVAPLAEASLQP